MSFVSLVRCVGLTHLLLSRLYANSDMASGQPDLLLSIKKEYHITSVNGSSVMKTDLGSASANSTDSIGVS